MKDRVRYLNLSKWGWGGEEMKEGTEEGRAAYEVPELEVQILCNYRVKMYCSLNTDSF